MNRRSFLLTLTGALAAPMIVRPGIIMPVKAIAPITEADFVRIHILRRYEAALEILAQGMAEDLFRNGTGPSALSSLAAA